jgi:hypothetical protein
VSFAEDEHAVGDLGAGGEHESFCVGVGSGAARWNLAHGDTGVGQHGVDGGGVLSGSVPDEVGELVGAFAGVHEQFDRYGAPPAGWLHER